MSSRPYAGSQALRGDLQRSRDTDAAARLLNRLHTRQEEIALSISQHVQHAVPDAAAERDTTFQAGILPTVRALLAYRLAAIEQGAVADEQIPPQAERQARRAARVGVKEGTILHRYVAGHRRLSQFIAQEAESLEIPSNDPALHRVRAIQDALLERLTAAVEQAYEQERDRAGGGSFDHHRMHAVRALLDQDTADPEDVNGLGYRLDAYHLALVAAGPDAPATLRVLESKRSVLLVAPDRDIAYAWIGGQHEPTPAEIHATLATLPSGRLRVGVGEPAHGTDGWRRSHRQAQEALRVAECVREPSTVRFGDVILLTPWLHDPARARELIELCLSPLDSKRDGGARARQTLQAYFSSGRNLTAAAQRLGVDRRTVSYRLRSIEDSLGRSLDSRAAEAKWHYAYTSFCTRGPELRKSGRTGKRNFQRAENPRRPRLRSWKQSSARALNRWRRRHVRLPAPPICG